LETAKAWGYRDLDEWTALPGWQKAALMAHEQLKAEMAAWEARQTQRRKPKDWQL
jgi:hypothetical protein